jgi:hypothetical protein
MTNDDLAAAERNVFRSVVDTGLWDVMLASVVAMFAIAPLLSSRLGDFWSSAVFLPFWAAVYLATRFFRERYVVPRVGVVRFGIPRQARLKKFGVILLIVNTISLVLAAVFTTRPGEPRMWVFPIVFSLIVLAVSSLAAYGFNIPRIFGYGVMIAFAPAIGEWLWRSGYAAHHGFPVVYGATAFAIAAIGITKLTLLIQSHPPVAPSATKEPSPAGNHD